MALFERKTPAPAPAPTPTPTPAAELTGEARKKMHMERIEEVLKSYNLNYSVDGNIAKFNMDLKSRIGKVLNLVVAEENAIQCFAACPINAKPEDYANVVEFITRANYGLKLGKFEFDYRDGEVRYQACLPSNEGIPSLKHIGRIAFIPFMMLDKYGDGLAKNLMGLGEPEKDIAKIENE